MHVAAARIAREAADAAEAADPTRPRFVAGSLGPTNKTASISPNVADPAARSITFEQLAFAYAEAARGPDHRRRGSADGRNHLRRPQRQGRDLRHRAGLRRAGRPAAAVDLRHDHRRVRADTFGAHGRGVLELDPPRAAAHRRLELRPRRAAAPGPRRGTGGPRGHVRGRASQRGPAQRIRRLRREPRGHGRGRGRVRQLRARERGRRLLRDGTRPRCRVRRGSPRLRAAYRPRGRGKRAPAGGHGGAEPLGRQPVHEHRRADERRGLARLRPADRRGRLRLGARHRPPSGRGRRAGDRRQHGRSDARFGGGHDPLPEPGRVGAGHRPRPDRRRFVEMVGHRSRACAASAASRS